MVTPFQPHSNSLPIPFQHQPTPTIELWNHKQHLKDKREYRRQGKQNYKLMNSSRFPSSSLVLQVVFICSHCNQNSPLHFKLNLPGKSQSRPDVQIPRGFSFFIRSNIFLFSASVSRDTASMQYNRHRFLASNQFLVWLKSFWWTL